MKPFITTLAAIRFGKLNDELTEATKDLVKKCAETGRSGEIKLSIKFKPGKGGQIEIFDEINIKNPKEDKQTTIMFSTSDGQLTREDPRQIEIEGLRTVDMETGELRKAN